MAYWIAKHDESPFEDKDIMVFPSLATALRYSHGLRHTGRHLPPPTHFSSDPFAAPPAEMLRALNRLVVSKAPQCEYGQLQVRVFVSDLDPFPAAYSTEQEWLDFFLRKWNGDATYSYPNLS